jgi:hypothetical protein
MDEMFLPKEEKRGKLRELLKNRERGFNTKLAKYCGVDRRTTQNWTKEGGAWPVGETEERLWEFFRKLERGHTPHQERTLSEVPTPIKEFVSLMHAPPEQQAGSMAIGEIQEILGKQINLFYRLAMPDGIPSESGLLTARRLILEHSPLHGEEKPPVEKRKLRSQSSKEKRH